MKSAFGIEHDDIAKRSDDAALLRRHGLRGAPTGVDRETRQKIWEARARHLNAKRNRWDRTSKTAKVGEVAGGTAATAVGATVAAHQLREAYFAGNRGAKAKAEGKANRMAVSAGVRSARAGNAALKVGRAAVHGKPGFKLLAAGATGAVVGAGSRKARIFADKKVRRYSSASGGIASGTARRMADYSVGKSDDVKHSKQVQAGLSGAAAVTGLMALGSKSGARLIPKVVGKTPKATAYANHLDRAASALVYAGGGIGGASGLHSAHVYRQESKVGKSFRSVAGKAGAGVLRRVGVKSVDSISKPSGRGITTVKQGWEHGGNRFVKPSHNIRTTKLTVDGGLASSTKSRRAPELTRTGKRTALGVGAAAYTGAVIHENRKAKAVSKSAFGVEHTIAKYGSNAIGAYGRAAAAEQLAGSFSRKGKFKMVARANKLQNKSMKAGMAAERAAKLR